MTARFMEAWHSHNPNGNFRHACPVEVEVWLGWEARRNMLLSLVEISGREHFGWTRSMRKYLKKILESNIVVLWKLYYFFFLTIFHNSWWDCHQMLWMMQNRDNLHVLSLNERKEFPHRDLQSSSSCSFNVTSVVFLTKAHYDLVFNI